jgi:hypothetical protein
MLHCSKLQLRGYTQFFNSAIIIIIIILNLIKKKIHILTCSDKIYLMEKLNGNNTTHSLSLDTRKVKRNIKTARNNIGSAKIQK